MYAKRHFTHHLFFVFFGMLLYFLQGTANAQTVVGLPDDEQIYELEPVIMTGSLLSNDYQSETLFELDYEDLILSGTQTPIEALRLQPAFFGAMNTSNDSNSGSGSSSPNIRGIGTLRTLTLINGRRAGGNSAFGLEPGGFSNLELIPQASIKQIDIFQESASTTYGADAIAGVVNFDLQSHFNGVRLDGLYGNTTEGGLTQQYSLIGGFKLDEDTHLTLLGSYYDQKVIWARDRSLSATTDYTSRGGTNRGSSTFPGRAVFKVGGVGTNGILAPGTPFPSSSLDYVPYNQNFDAFNYNEYAPDIPGMSVASGYASIEHNLSAKTTLYADALYSYENQDNGLAPSPWVSVPSTSLFTAIENSVYNPFAPGDLNQLLYRNFELGNLNVDNHRNAFRLVGGARGLIENRWEWDTAALYTQTTLDSKMSGIADARKLIPFINSGDFNPFARVPAGNSAGTAFNNYASLQQAAIEADNQYYENLFSYDAKVSGKLTDLPTGPIRGALGVEYRYESIDASPDSIWSSGENLGGAGYTQPYSGQRNVFALFSEVFIPIISDSNPIATIDNLDINLGLRYENFSDTGDSPVLNIPTSNSYNNLSWKAVVTLKPTKELTFRGSYSTGFRAPTLFESYSSEIYDYPTLVDPTGATPPGTPIPTAISGNPSLKPEVSQNFAASVTWEPDFTPGLSFSVNYYYVRIDDAIANGAQFILDQNNPSDVFRSPIDGSVVFVKSRYFNASSITTQGVDYGIDYTIAIEDRTSLKLSLGLNQVIDYRAEVPGVGKLDFAGRYVDKRSNSLSPGAIPRWKGLASVLVTINQLKLGATTQYIGSYEDDPNFTAGGLPRTVDDYIRVNLIAQYLFENTGSNLINNTTVTLGIDNVFDASPPFAAGAFADGYDTSLYTIQNRFVYCAISKSF